MACLSCPVYVSLFAWPLPNRHDTNPCDTNACLGIGHYLHNRNMYPYYMNACLGLARSPSMTACHLTAPRAVCYSHAVHPGRPPLDVTHHAYKHTNSSHMALT